MNYTIPRMLACISLTVSALGGEEWRLRRGTIFERRKCSVRSPTNQVSALQWKAWTSYEMFIRVSYSHTLSAKAPLVIGRWAYRNKRGHDVKELEAQP